MATDISIEVVTDPRQLMNTLKKMATLLNELKTDLSEHTHGGVTAGAGTTSAGAAISSPSITVPK
jgi:hypothetical protein